MEDIFIKFQLKFRSRYRGFLSVFCLLFLISCSSKPSCDFLVASDLHYNGNELQSMVLDSAITLMNSTKTMEFPFSKDKKFNPFGVIIPGDITEGREQDWNEFVNAFGLKGENKLKMPVFESFGNHDGPIGGVVREGIKARNPERAYSPNISDNGMHYSFDRGGVHFVVLGSYPGNEWDPNCEWCHYFHTSFRDAEMSLAFLEHDLNNNLKSPNQPVMVFFHYGFEGWSLVWTTEAERENFYNVVKDKNLIGVIHGHDHGLKHYQWKGIDFWSDGSPQRGRVVGSFLGVKIKQDSMYVAAFNNGNWELLTAKSIAQNVN